MPGDRVFVDGLSNDDRDRQVPDQLNPKKKIWDRLQVSDVTDMMISTSK